MSFNQFIRALPLLLLLVLCFSISMGLFRAPFRQDTHMIGRKIQNVDIAGLSGPARFTPRLWNGQVSIVSAFASWCEPCRQEHTLLMDLSRLGKVPIYGIAWRDTPEKATAWLGKLGNPYQAIGIDTGGITTIPLSLSGVPETFVIAKDGTVRYHFRASLTTEEINQHMLPLIDTLNAEGVSR